MLFRIFLLFSLSCYPFLLVGQISWQQLPEAPFVQRDDAVAVALNQYAYVGTGLSSSFAPLNDWWRFSSVNHEWEQMAVFSGPARQYASAFVINERIYIVGGTGAELYNDLWEYDVEGNNWEQRTSIPAAGRSSSATFVLNNEAYLCGGFLGVGDYTDEVWKYNGISDEWEMVQNLPVEMRLAAGFQIANNGYIVGGFNQQDGTLNSCYRYNPDSNMWFSCADLPEPLLDAKGISVPNFGVVLCGGNTFSELTSAFYWYSPDFNTWLEGPEFPGAVRKGGVGFLLSDVLFFGTGIGSPPQNQRFNDFYLIDWLSNVNDQNPLNVSVFPNPAINNFQVQINLNNALVDLVIYDVQGKIIHSQLVRDGEQISTLNWAPGVYILHIFQNQSNKVVRLVIQP